MTVRVDALGHSAQLRVQAARVFRAQRRRRFGVPASPALPRQRRIATADPDRGHEHERDRDEPQRRVEAVACPGPASTDSPYSATSAALICSLSLPSAICSRMNSRSCCGDGRAGDAEHRAALDAHHLVLDVRQRSARRLSARRRHERQGQRHGQQRDPHAFSASSFGRCSSSHACVTGKRRIAAIRPLRSMMNVSG